MGKSYREYNISTFIYLYIQYIQYKQYIEYNVNVFDGRNLFPMLNALRPLHQCNQQFSFLIIISAGFLRFRNG